MAAAKQALSKDLPAHAAAAIEGAAANVTALMNPGGPGPWPFGHRSIRGERYKLVEYADGTEEVYDLQGVVVEGDDLLDGSLTSDEQAALDALRDAWPFAW